MSGIAGIIHFDGRPVEPGQVEAMTAAMHYRGPDGINHWRKGSVALGQCMLYTTSESLDETQPLTNEDESLILVMDGRVDNWEELRRELLGKGVMLRTRADAELVLRAYEIWGRDCLIHIDGDFVIVIWDDRVREAFFARDRIGVKLIHYHWNGKSLAFATELHPILDLPWVDRQLNDGMLAELLASDLLSRHETLWEGVMRLQPAHVMQVSCCGLQSSRYWLPDTGSNFCYLTDDEYFEHYRELLIDSVRRLSRSHRSIACELSGGLDSSALFCVGHHLLRAGRLLTSGLDGYTLAFDDHTDADEVHYARTVGKHVGVEIHEVKPLVAPLNWYERHVADYCNFPGFPNSLMFQGIFQQAKEAGSRVLINGAGGDEWLTSSKIYYAEELQAGRVSTLFSAIMEDVKKFGMGHVAHAFLKFGAAGVIPLPWQRHLKRLNHSLSKYQPITLEWLTPKTTKLHSERKAKFISKNDQFRGNAAQQELFKTLQDPHRSWAMEIHDRLVSGWGLEVRYPFHERRLVEFAFATPARLRLRAGCPKYTHVQAMTDLVPKEVIERTDKAEFSNVFRSVLDGLQPYLESEATRLFENEIAPRGLRQVFTTYNINKNTGWPLWALWNLYACVTIKACFLDSTQELYMSENLQSQSVSSQNVELSKEKSVYVAPVLSVFGSVSDLTLTGGGTKADGAGTKRP